jgi:hypothetical protein
MGLYCYLNYSAGKVKEEQSVKGENKNEFNKYCGV